MAATDGQSTAVDDRTLTRVYRAAYAAALAGSLASAGLTYVYVGNGARELNPVVRAIIASVGLEGMVLVKTAIIVGCYHGYVRLVPPVSPQVMVAVAWVGSMVNLANGVYDLSVAVRAGVPPLGDALTGVLLVVAAGLLGVALRPATSERYPATAAPRS